VLGEKFLLPQNYRNGDWHDDAGWSDGWDPDIIRYTAFPPLRDVDPSPYGWEGYQFGSAHVAGFNGLFGDGSVRNIKYSVDLQIFNSLGDRRDGGLINFAEVE
jgi:hypothetical protein